MHGFITLSAKVNDFLADMWSWAINDEATRRWSKGGTINC